MANAGMTLDGFEGLDKKLTALPKKVAKKIVRTATRDAAKVTLKQVKTNAGTSFSLVKRYMANTIIERA